MKVNLLKLYYLSREFQRLQTKDYRRVKKIIFIKCLGQKKISLFFSTFNIVYFHVGVFLLSEYTFDIIYAID